LLNAEESRSRTIIFYFGSLELWIVMFSKNRVSLAVIDQKGLDAFIENHGIFWPCPREAYGTFHNYLMAKGGRLAVYDVLIT
jgi:hypothetical protein